MEELLEYFDEEASSEDAKLSQESFRVPGSHYKSVIQFSGRPILPPLMTQQKCEEMQMYKRQAMLTETRIRARIRQRLLSRVQSVMHEIEARHSPDVSESQEQEVPPLDLTTLQQDKDSPCDVERPRKAQVVVEGGEVRPETKATRLAGGEIAGGLPNKAESSPRTCTKDSGVFSKESRDLDGHDPSPQRPESLREEAVEDDLLDTMANVTDLSAEEEAGEEEVDTIRVDSVVCRGFKEVDTGDLSPSGTRSDTLTLEDQPSIADRVSDSDKATVKEQGGVTAEESDAVADSSKGTLQELVMSDEDKSEPLSDSDKENVEHHSGGSDFREGSDTRHQDGDVAGEGSVHPEITGRLPVDGDLVESGEVHVLISVDETSTLSDTAGASKQVSTVQASGDLKGDDVVQTADGKEPNSGVLLEKPTAQSSSSSATTLSSDELQRTIILRQEQESVTDRQGVDQGGDKHSSQSGSSQSETVREELVDLPEQSVGPMRDNSTQSDDVGDRLSSPEPGEDLYHADVSSTDEGGYSSPKQTPLLNKVALVCDTPDGTSVDLSDHEDLSLCPNQNEASIKNGLNNSVESDPLVIDTPQDSLPKATVLKASSASPPGPVSTANETVIPENFGKRSFTIESTMTNVHNLPAAPVSPEDKSVTDTSHLYTASTELAPYMEYSMDTVPSMMSTLPHGHDLSNDGTNLASARGKTNSPVEMLDGSVMVGAFPRAKAGNQEVVYVVDVASDGDGVKPSGEESATADQNTASGDAGVPLSHGRDIEPCPEEQGVFPLTSSMEDLKLKPVQRRLDYGEQYAARDQELHEAEALEGTERETVGSEQPPSQRPPGEVTQPTTADDMYVEVRQRSNSETEGKEEHLQRYLQQLSQMPIYLENGQSRSSPTMAATHTASKPANGHPATSNAQKEDINYNVSSVTVDSDLGQRGDGYADMVQRPFTAPPLGAAELNTSVTNSTAAHEEFLAMQLQYFEMMKQQLIERQQRQLVDLLAEQERQHMLLQEEIVLQEESQWMQQQNQTEQRQHSSQKPHSAPATALQHSAIAQRKQQLDRVNQHTQSGQTSRSLKQSSRTHGTKVAAGFPSAVETRSHTSIASGIVHDGNEGVNDSFEQPHSAMVPRVSFAVDQRSDLGTAKRSPAGVYCNTDFPLSPSSQVVDGSFHEPSTSLEGPFRSPSVLKYGPAANTSSMTPPSILKKTPPEDLSMSDVMATSDVEPSGEGSLAAVHEVRPPASSAPQLQAAMAWHRRFEKVSAAVKGYLTRRLLKTEKVQLLIKTVRDTAEFALNFQQETPIKKGIYSLQDQRLQQSVLAQLTAVMYEIHEIFFELPIAERMAIIAMSRTQERERLYKQKSYITRTKTSPGRKLSLATLKAMDRRKQAQAAEATLFGHVRAKSAPPPTSSSPRQLRSMDLRALRPIQTQFSPIKPDREALMRASVEGKSKRKSMPSSPVKRIQTKAKPVASGAGKSSKNGQMSSKSARPSSQLRPKATTGAKRVQEDITKVATGAKRVQEDVTKAKTSAKQTPTDVVKAKKPQAKVMVRHHSKPDRSKDSPELSAATGRGLQRPDGTVRHTRPVTHQTAAVPSKGSRTKSPKQVTRKFVS